MLQVGGGTSLVPEMSCGNCHKIPAESGASRLPLLFPDQSVVGKGRGASGKETQVTACITCYISEIKTAAAAASLATITTAAVRSPLDQGRRTVTPLLPKLFGRVRVCSSSCYLPEISQNLQANQKASPNTLETSRCLLSRLEFN